MRKVGEAERIVLFGTIAEAFGDVPQLFDLLVRDALGSPRDAEAFNGKSNLGDLQSFLQAYDAHPGPLVGDALHQSLMNEVHQRGPDCAATCAQEIAKLRFYQ